jgi:hypothetical protein
MVTSSNNSAPTAMVMDVVTNNHSSSPYSSNSLPNSSLLPNQHSNLPVSQRNNRALTVAMVTNSSNSQHSNHSNNLLSSL